MSLAQVALISACVSSSHRLDSKPATPPQETAWITKLSNLPASDAGYRVQFVSENDAFLASSKGLWRSIDGGRNWKQVHQAPESEKTITKARFLDGTVGWMETNSGWYKSEDGGNTWALFVTPLSFPVNKLWDVKFINQNTGWIAGAALRAPFREELGSKGLPNVPRHSYDDITKKVLTPSIYRTDDGGRTWQRQTVPGVRGYIKTIRFIDPDHGIALSDHNALQTRNGGKTWLAVQDPQTCVDKNEEAGGYEGGPASAYWLGSSSAWIAFDDGRMIKTTDGWQTSLELQPCDEVRPVVVHFSSQERGIGLDSHGSLYETTDGGKQWTRVGTDKYESLSSLDSQHLWLLSERELFRVNNSR